MSEQSMRDRVVEVLSRPTHAPMETHSQLDGSCTECPWPTYALRPEDIADAILPLIEEAKAEAWREGLRAEERDRADMYRQGYEAGVAAAIRGAREPGPATEASPRPKPRDEKMVVAKIIDAVDNNTYRGAGQLLASDWLRERDAEKWDEGHAYGFYDQSENTKHSNPYREPEPATEEGSNRG